MIDGLISAIGFWPSLLILLAGGFILAFFPLMYADRAEKQGWKIPAFLDEHPFIVQIVWLAVIAFVWWVVSK